MSAQRDPETSPDAETDKNGPEKQQLQTPNVFGHVKKAEKMDLDLHQRLGAKDDDDDEVIIAITDTYMNTIDLSVVYEELSCRIFNIENEKPIAEVGDSRIGNDLRIEIHHEQLQFESIEEDIAWITSIKEDIRKLRLNILQMAIDVQNRSSSSSVINNWNVQAKNTVHRSESLQGAAGFMSLFQQFDDKFKEYAKCNSKEEEVVARKIVQIMERVSNSEMSKFDPKAITMQLMERQIFFQKVQQKLANLLWKVQFVAPPAYGEQMLVSRNAVESAAMIQHVFLELMFQLDLGKTESFMEKLIDGYILALLATGEAHKVREKLSVEAGTTAVNYSGRQISSSKGTSGRGSKDFRFRKRQKDFNSQMQKNIDEADDKEDRV
ncbi:MAG: hypothetical protein EZS28_003121 [Streblomastix strix]|uniref:Uncharacterized protein n=1 Tax=Streblomastix strix TaxID=222440 RepID=A0A5J4X1X5_9EUKA|nr:MAG: hypothetical protein EZS28_003121 [Streblomastix strix]